MDTWVWILIIAAVVVVVLAAVFVAMGRRSKAESRRADV